MILSFSIMYKLFPLIFLDLIKFSTLHIPWDLEQNIVVSKDGSYPDISSINEAAQKLRRHLNKHCGKIYCNCHKLAAEFWPGANREQIKQIAVEHGLLFKRQVMALYREKYI